MGRFTAFLIGGAVGAIAGLALSPASGSENIDRVSGVLTEAYPEQTKVVKEAAGQAVAAAATNSTKIINTVVDNAGDFTSNLGARAQQVVGGAPQAVSAQSEELREKIDSARDRIAAQVKKNAEETAGK